MKPIFIAGPCVIESQECLDTVAQELLRLNARYGLEIIFKASFDKANRTSISSYRGPGMEKGLQMLADIKAKYGLQLLTDIHEAYQAAPVAEVVDVLQIPASCVVRPICLSLLPRPESVSTSRRHSSCRVQICSILCRRSSNRAARKCG